jgi:hypothetical protein
MSLYLSLQQEGGALTVKWNRERGEKIHSHPRTGLCELGLVVHTCDSSTQEFEASLGYIVRPYLKNKKKFALRQKATRPRVEK